MIGKVATLAKAMLDRDLRRDFLLVAKARANQHEASCPCCGYKGRLKNFGHPLRYGVMCPICSSLERHRLLALAVQRGVVTFAGKSLLHFAPEPAARRIISTGEPSKYVTSSYPPDPASDLSLNIEDMDLPSDSFDTILCSHVLEHVDDRAALKELFRVLTRGGQLVAMVPIIEGWHGTYEDPQQISPSARTIHFGQDDHVRFYGSDFRKRVTSAGFQLSEFVATGAECVDYALTRGERVFVGGK